MSNSHPLRESFDEKGEALPPQAHTRSPETLEEAGFEQVVD